MTVYESLCSLCFHLYLQQEARTCKLLLFSLYTCSCYIAVLSVDLHFDSNKNNIKCILCSFSRCVKSFNYSILSNMMTFVNLSQAMYNNILMTIKKDSSWIWMYMYMYFPPMKTMHLEEYNKRIIPIFREKK